VDHAVDGGVGSEPQRQCEERHQGESRIPPEPPYRPLQIPQHRLDLRSHRRLRRRPVPVFPVDPLDPGPDDLHVAEGLLGQSTGFLRGVSRFLELASAFLQVVADLLAGA